MKLPLAVIQDALRTVGYSSERIGNEESVPAGRPVLWTPGRKGGGNLVCLPDRTEDLEFLPRGVYLSFSDAWASRLSEQSSLLVVRQEQRDGMALFNALQEIYDRYDALDEALTDVIEHDRGYGAFIDLSTEYLGGLISIVDYDFNYVAYSKGMTATAQIVDDRIGAEEMSEHLANPEFERVKYERDVFFYLMGENRLVCYNFYRNGVYIGRLVLERSGTSSEGSAVFFVRYLAGRLEVMIDRYGSFMREAGRRSAVKLALSGVLQNDVSGAASLPEALKAMGWEDGDRFVLIRLHPEFRHERVLHTGYFASLIEARWSQTAVVEFRDFIVILADLTRMPGDRDIRSELSGFLREYLMLASFSREFIGCGRIPAAYRQTEIAFTIGRDRDPTRWSLHFDDYALAYWIRSGSAEFLPEEICSPALLRLISVDREKGTEYYPTLKALFRTGFNYSRAADALYIHRTTLINRAARMTELTGLDLDDPDTRLYLELSMRYWEGSSGE